MTTTPVIAAVLLTALAAAAIPWAMVLGDCKLRARVMRHARPDQAGTAPGPLPGAVPPRPRNGVIRPDRPRTHPETRVDLPVLDGPVVPRWYGEWEKWRDAGGLL